ncbi:MAG: FGGY-family carbohydrate kinase [Spirochaetales bacterium]|jgi:sugar (pentulose or hexulose) kinase|nr:FGGY-family carbohydrate kinase [Spirochaetales bacterium]
MSKKYVIGIDGGSQSTKVVIFDLEGRVVSEGKEKLRPLQRPSPGVAEHPDDDLWNSLVIACRRAFEDFYGDVGDILAVGLCTIRCCRADLKKDGSLASPVMSWMDARLSKPYEHVNPEVSYVTTSSGYIGHRITGEFQDTASNYEGPWPIDKDTWDWSMDQEVLQHYNLPPRMLFDLVKPGSLLGTVTPEAAAQTCIPAGLPVAATANDNAVEALGVGLMPGNTLLVSLGTYIGSMVYGKENIKDAQSFFSNMASVPDKFLYESGGIRKGMWTVSWFKDLLGEEFVSRAHAMGSSPEALLDAEAEKINAGSDGLMTVLDWLAPPDRPFKKGLMIGFDARHTRAHMFRSILEGIALTMKNYADAMCEELGMMLDSIIVSGGGSNSTVFMQIFSDVFGVPAVRTMINESASVGSAICAASAVGYYDSFAEAVSRMVHQKDVFTPIDEHTELYKEMNEQVYKHVTEYTDSIFRKSYPIFGK